MSMTDNSEPKIHGVSMKNLLPLEKLRRLLEGLRHEERRSDLTLHLTAYENRLSKLAQSMLLSNLSFRQHEGILERHSKGEVILHGSFMFMGLPGVYALEQAACDASRELFHAAFSDFRPTSGLHAVLCLLSTVTNPGETIYSIDPKDGGHFATKHILTRLGRKSRYMPWARAELTIDLDALEALVRQDPPHAILFDYGTPLFRFPIRDIRRIVGEKPKLIYDASHTLGLIAGHKFQDPLTEGCDVLQGNTHKTFPGPQHAMVHYRDRNYGLSISDSITAGLISNQHTHHSLATYVTTLEMSAFGKAYALQMINNGRVLANSLANKGFSLISRGQEYTETHQIAICGPHIDETCRRLFACGISTNARNAFGTRIIRIGVQEVTRRGMNESEMETIGDFFARVVSSKESIDTIRKEVAGFNECFKDVHYSFDADLGL
jgi:glycine hydroxymethyltransferase